MLKNKVVLITGAGSGLGRALAQAFCKEGCQVIGLGRQQARLEETADSIGGENFTYYAVDVLDYDLLSRTVGEVSEKHQTIDILFNNAAVYPKINFVDESAGTFTEAIEINVIGVANVCKAVLPVMFKQDSGRIYNLGSWADLSPIANSAAYSASKGAIHALTKGIAADIAHLQKQVEVHEWIPGHLNTQMSDYTGIDPSVSAGWAVMLAQRTNTKKNSIFERDQEWLPPKSLKQKIKSKLQFWK
ncbi:MAG: NADP-dependent 3-hydroxy acid dehydrogenase YdfG [Cellvibrionaceae bacterium]|jgi:NADP-dependent 3-hydroxy acid dehydrogenase YdfG